MSTAPVRSGTRPDRTGEEPHHDAELAQQTAQKIDRSGALRLVELTNAMQPLDALLLGRLDRHASDRFTAFGFEQASGIGAVGLVPAHVRPHVMRGQQLDGMAEPDETPGPIVRRPAGFHDDAQRRTVVERTRERGACQSSPFVVALADLGVACMAVSFRDPVSEASCSVWLIEAVW